MDSIGGRIKDVRKSFKLTQAQFAQEVAISQTHVSKIEKDIEHPSSTLIRLISIRYNVDESWLITGLGALTPNFDVITNDGLISKYNYMRVQFEQQFKTLPSEDIYNMVESYSYLVGLLMPAKLNAESASAYRNAIRSAIDEMEKLIFMVSVDHTLLPSKKDASGWINFRNSCEEKVKEVENSLKKATNLYLEKFGEGMKI